jgi:uncharacterized protein YndB with AHSA1/START domain
MTGSYLVLTRVFPAEIERVFEAWTRPDLLSQWFAPAADSAAEVTSDVRVGGRYRIAIHRGGRRIGAASGEYLEIDPPARLVFTWTSEGAVTLRDSVVTVDLRPVQGGTELTLTHTVRRDSEEGRAHERGWQATLASLERFVESRR